jgi:type IV secretory pathway VirB10-like protein
MLLAVSGVAVLAMGIYLVLEVGRSSDIGSAPIASRTVEPVPESTPPPAPIKPERIRKPPRAPAKVEAVPDEPEPVAEPATPAQESKITSGTSMARMAPDLEVNRELQEQMAAANKAYDRQRMDEARSHAEKVLAQAPDNARMLRVMVSSWCIEGESDQATKWFAKLAEGDRDAMRTRCERYGVTLP